MIYKAYTIKKYLYLLIGLWSICFLIIWALIYSNAHDEFRKHIVTEARTILNKDLSFRAWATMHGGVYVFPTKKTPPNPYLKFLPHRDVVTQKGKKLTLMNPAYIIRQVMEMYESVYGIKGHITSLKLVNPRNKPDDWEVSVLKGFQADKSIKDILIFKKDRVIYRQMMPLMTTKGCLKCHALQQYKVGDVRGGLSVTIPVTEEYILVNNNIIKESLMLAGIYFLGILGLVFSSSKNIKDRNELAHYVDSLSRYEEIVSATKDMLAFIDRDFKYLAINDMYIQLFAKERQEIIGHHIREIIGEKDFNDILQYLERCLNGAVVSYERWAVTPDSKKICLDISYYPYINKNGMISGIVASLKDITEHKFAEDKINNSLKEKEVLLTEVHHRVKNNMAVIISLLSLQAYATNDDKIMEMFTDSMNRIQSMALVHEKLYQTKDFMHIDVKDYLYSLIESLKDSLNISNTLGIYTDIDAVVIDIEILIPCGLIINELITNTVKHAFTSHENPEVHISLKEKDNTNVILTIADNGIGLPAGFDVLKSKGLGLQLVNTLTSQINGALEIKSDEGAHFYLQFPKKSAVEKNNST